MTRFLWQYRLSYLKFTTSLLQPQFSEVQAQRSYSVLGILVSIMGKVRNNAGTNKPNRLASEDPSTSLKVKKFIEEKLMAKQNVKFKSKATGTALGHGLPTKGEKKKLQKELVTGALRDESLQNETNTSVKRQINLLSAGAASKIDPGLSPRAKRKKKQKRDHKGDDPTLTKPGTLFEMNAISDVPLAVEMPKRIDESDTTLSELNTTSDFDATSSMDTSDDIDSSPIIPPQSKMDEAANIPLAVIMPGDSSTPITKMARKEKKKTLKANKPVVNLTDIEEPQNVEHSVNDEATESNTTESVMAGVDCSRKSLSERDRVLEKVKVHFAGSSIVLQLSHPTKFYIFGQVEVQVLSGRIRILGYEIDKHNGSHVVSSLRGSSFMSIETSRPGVNGKLVEFPPGLPDEAALRSLIGSFTSNDVWVLLKEGNRDFLEYMQTYLEFPISLKELKSSENSPLLQAQEDLHCVFEPELALGKRITELPMWKTISEAIIRERHGCTVLCGGKGVGKSTLLRYLVNSVLSSGDVGARGVVVVDFDPGQAELTPPGCVAVSLIKTPLLGPNYTHLQYPERCVYIGEISVTQCLGRYMEASISIIRFVKESPHLATFPCIVNTMGFTHGIGVTIMGQLLQLLQPTRVVQIESKRKRDNYPFRLTKSGVVSHSQSTDSLCVRESLRLMSPKTEKDNLNYEFRALQSAAEAAKSKDENVWGMKPNIARNAVILSYFSSLVQPPSYSILDNIPFSCPLGTLFLGVTHENVAPDMILSAMNGNMVALCTIDPTTTDVLCHPDPAMPRVLSKIPIAPCVGFGIVRGVDMEAKMLYVTTPLEEEKLCLVNCLIYGVVNLPTSVIIKSTAPGLVPYVSSGQFPDVFTQ